MEQIGLVGEQQTPGNKVVSKLEQRSWEDRVMMDLRAKVKMMFIAPNRSKGRVCVKPPKDVAQVGFSKWDTTVVEYFIGKKLPFQLERVSTMCMWRTKGLYKVMENDDDDFFFFRFSSVANKNDIVEGGQ